MGKIDISIWGKLKFHFVRYCKLWNFTLLIQLIMSQLCPFCRVFMKCSGILHSSLHVCMQFVRKALLVSKIHTTYNCIFEEVAAQILWLRNYQHQHQLCWDHFHHIERHTFTSIFQNGFSKVWIYYWYIIYIYFLLSEIDKLLFSRQVGQLSQL